MTIFLVFLFAYTLSQFYRSFLAVIAPDLARTRIDGERSRQHLCHLVRVFALAQFPLGFALDRIGPRRTVPTLMLVAVAGAVAVARAGPRVYGRQRADRARLLTDLHGSAVYFGRTAGAGRFGFLSAWTIGIGSSGNLLASTPLSWQRRYSAGVRLSSASRRYTAGALLVLADRARPAARRSGRHRPAQRDGHPGNAEMRALWTMIPLGLLGYGTGVVERGLWLVPILLKCMASIHRTRQRGAGDGGGDVGGCAGVRLARSRAGAAQGAGGVGSLLAAVGFAALWLLPLPAPTSAIVTLAFIGCLGLAIRC